MAGQEKFEEQRHIDQIRERLWCGREYGQAAVMIGAGFSRSAERFSASVPLFPLWTDLEECFIQDLYSVNGMDDSRIDNSNQSKGPLKLASEYEATFGRMALENCLIQNIPDALYAPGYLHKLLLSLPWSDVFTANYDTLLERALPEIYDRKYDLILTPSDIPGRMKPRIIKLHGSFPSHRPFIITEDDYRTYPRKFSSFVNMVQQSLMENAFCLLGFSGDDPNFIFWSGWVRDNLGDNAPKIYLCGILDLSAPKKRVLENRGIIPIDLSPLFSEDKYPNRDARHRMAIEWFLLNLMNGAPPNVFNWPNPGGNPGWSPSSDLPIIPSGPDTFPNPGPAYPPNRSLNVEDLTALSDVWRECRRAYPGWVVAPNDNRKTLWNYTKDWIEPVFESYKELPAPQEIYLLYELNWRIEISLFPLFLPWVNKITSALETYNPFPERIEIDTATIKPDLDDSRNLPWEDIRNYWTTLAFAVTRKAREDQDEKRFNLWIERLEKLVSLHADWQNRWFYEQCLFYLLRYDQENVRRILSSWQNTGNLPFWESKQASIFAELGELEKAEKATERALDDIRSQQRPLSFDYTLMSQEGWTMMLLKSIRDNKLESAITFSEQVRDRWQELETHRCNPWSELEQLKWILDAPKPRKQLEIERKRTFDPERITLTRHLSAESEVIKYLPAFTFLRIYEEGSLPIKSGKVGIFIETVINAAKWITAYAPLWSIGTLIRSENQEKIKDWFSRVRTGALEQNKINYIKDLLLVSLNQGLNYVSGKKKSAIQALDFSINQIALACEILSRLAFRLPLDVQKRLLDLALRLYNMREVQNRFILHDPIGVLFTRILYTLPQSELLNKIPILLALRIPDDAGFKVNSPQRWVEPFDAIIWPENTRIEDSVNRSEWSSHILNLNRITRDGAREARARAVSRLVKLYEVNGLTHTESEDFGKALWSRIDENKSLPSDTHLADASFLFLPEIEAGIAKKNLQDYLNNIDFPRIILRKISPDGKEKKSINIDFTENSIIQAWLGSTAPFFPDESQKDKFIDWTSKEAATILEKAISWWDEEKAELKSSLFAHSFGLDKLRAQFRELIRLIQVVILPRLAETEDNIKTSAQRLLDEMDQMDFCILRSLPATLFFNPSNIENVADRIRTGLNSVNEGIVKEGIFGLFNWIANSRVHSMAAPPPDLLADIINKALTRRQPALINAIAQLSEIIKYLPEIFNPEQIDSLCTALTFLLEETKLPGELELEEMNSGVTPIPFEDRLEYRRYSAELAYRLFKMHQNLDRKIPAILKKWEEAVHSDPLPEVRRAWLIS